ncbi:lecithin-cholesterol acyltransferase-like 1 [Rhodamnia argentea]|uniref:Lecithin-cholesterol acyltransferase-like 1 n=1 Tax=Rhodamnia argentea TaxID=178133 RepID=A0A8B8P1J5_9MYRT|nr:lecithin-cholesterol acyltransferase-like 1 [Rhodamnia argentea]
MRNGDSLLLARVAIGLTWAAAMLCACHSRADLHPLIIVPGSGGNQLEARLTGEYKASSLLCSRLFPPVKDRDGWFRLWFEPSVLLAPFTKCFADRMTLYYDWTSDDYYNAPGVETRVCQFGSTESLRHLDPHLKQATSYMATLVESLQKVGYVDGETLFGAPYDFRYGLAADGHPSRVGSKFLQDLKDLIEKAAASNKGKPVILLSHSLGGLFTLQLLNRNPSSWLRRHVKHFIALSAPWGGAVDELLTFASGNALKVPLVDPLIVRGEQRSSESNLWLLPSPKVFDSEELLVISPFANYTARDIVQFLDDIGFPEGIRPYESRILPLVERLSVPDVPVTCMFGSSVKTPEKLTYRSKAKGFDEPPEVAHGDGDGTVNMASLLGLESLWEENPKQPFKVVTIPGVSHMSILKEEIALREIVQEIVNIHANRVGSSYVRR